MKSFRNRRPVGHSAAEMFALVSDVDAYPKFVPLCEGMRVRRRTQ
ncbi:MAG: SRPBCC family protein, partial [Methylocystis sp.]